MPANTPRKHGTIIDDIKDFGVGILGNHAWKGLVILFLTTFCMVFYLYLNPPLNRYTSGLAEQIINLPGDFPSYVWRFGMATLFLGIIPLSICFVLGFRPARLGLRWDWSFLHSRVFWIFLISNVLIAVASTKKSELFSFYPFSKTLITAVKENGWMFGVHAVCYTLFYYLPWEIMFRGVLVFPFIPKASLDSKLRLERYPTLLVLAAIQTMPTTLMHIVHPITETLGAIPFGIICAYLTLRFRTILAPLVLHATVGVLVDLVIILGH